MATVLTVLAVWCALSLLLAGAHHRWCRYAEAVRPRLVLRRTPDRLVPNRHESDAAGSDVADFFRSFALQQ